MKKTNIAGALIIKNNRFLLVKAKVGAPKGLWNNPGGHLEKGEVAEESVKREVFEETGYKIDIGRLIGTYIWKRNLNEIVIKKVYEAKIISGKLKIPEEEIEKVKYFSHKEIKKDSFFTFGAKKSIEDYVEGKFNQKYKCDKVP